MTYSTPGKNNIQTFKDLNLSVNKESDTHSTEFAPTFNSCNCDKISTLFTAWINPN